MQPRCCTVKVKRHLSSGKCSHTISGYPSRYCVHCRFVAAMNIPGGGKNDIPNRLKRHFAIFYVPPPSTDAVIAMFGALMKVKILLWSDFTRRICLVHQSECTVGHLVLIQECCDDSDNVAAEARIPWHTQWHAVRPTMLLRPVLPE